MRLPFIKRILPRLVDHGAQSQAARRGQRQAETLCGIVDFDLGIEGRGQPCVNCPLAEPLPRWRHDLRAAAFHPVEPEIGLGIRIIVPGDIDPATGLRKRAVLHRIRRQFVGRKAERDSRLFGQEQFRPFDVQVMIDRIGRQRIDQQLPKIGIPRRQRQRMRAPSLKAARRALCGIAPSRGSPSASNRPMRRSY